ncbi:MAG: hypothetical protein HZC47_06450 [Methanobacterium sp.]|uniref:hypothetical protein n=1 Tax=Methanobacterium sp. TaxID=2164 RepID=UPI003D65CE7C|nr:hypothetical protein [Methanobacterium sp.]
MESEDKEALEIIYGEVSYQFQGAFRTYKTIRERAGQLIGFVGIILNLELLAILQILNAKIVVQFIIILVISSIFAIASLIMSGLAYRQALFQTLKSEKYLEPEYINKSKSELLKIISKEKVEDMKINKKILHERAVLVNSSMYFLIFAIVSGAAFILINVASLYDFIYGLIIVLIAGIVIYIILHDHFRKKIGL